MCPTTPTPQRTVEEADPVPLYTVPGVYVTFGTLNPKPLMSLYESKRGGEVLTLKNLTTHSAPSNRDSVLKKKPGKLDFIEEASTWAQNIPECDPLKPIRENIPKKLNPKPHKGDDFLNMIISNPIQKKKL